MIDVVPMQTAPSKGRWLIVDRTGMQTGKVVINYQKMQLVRLEIVTKRYGAVVVVADNSHCFENFVKGEPTDSFSP